MFPMNETYNRASHTQLCCAVTCERCSVVSIFLQTHGLYNPWNSPGQNPGVGILCLLQGIFPTQWSNPGLLHCRQILYQLSHQQNPRILEWVAYPFSSRSSQPRNQIRISCIAGRFFINWAIREALAIVNSSAVNTGVHVAFSILVSQGICLEVVFLGYMVVLLLGF